MAGRTLTEKIAARHRVRGDAVAGSFVTLRPRHLMTHDNSAAIIERFRHSGAPGVRYPWQCLVALDHDVQNTDPERMATWLDIARFCEQQHVDFRPCGSGIGHEIMVSEGLVVPGALCVAADSHANIYGALAALGTPVVRADAAAIWATGEFWWQVPESVQVVLNGSLSEGVSGKDLILGLCARFAGGEVRDRALEFCGPGVASLSMEDRLTVANMSTEWGAVAALFPVDDRTMQWMEAVRVERIKRGQRRFTRQQMDQWQDGALAADADAHWAARIEVDLDSVRSTAVGPDNLATPLAPGAAITVDKAFLVGCANARLADLRAAAQALDGRRVHSSVQFYVAAASREVQDDAVREGIWQTLIQAGARTLPPGCAMCIGLGEGVLRAGEVAVSATNRNWPGRMGEPGADAWLASPATVARAAVEGQLRGPDRPTNMQASFQPGFSSDRKLRQPDLCAGLETQITGRALLVRADDLDTDQIYPSTAVYRPLERHEMASLLLQNHDPQGARRIATADLLIGGFNFGCGSSREQAVTALQAAGIRAVIAGSLARTFSRNAANNGLPCVESPELARMMQARHAQATEPTLLLQGEVEIDFAASTLRALGEEFPFIRPAEPIQRLILDGGIQSTIRARFISPDRWEPEA